MDIDITDDHEAFAAGDEDVNWDQVEELQVLLAEMNPNDDVLPFYDKLAGHTDG